MLSCMLIFMNKAVVLVGIYVPPPASAQILHLIMQHVVQFDIDLVFLLGDFSMVPSVALDGLIASACDSDLR